MPLRSARASASCVLTALVALSACADPPAEWTASAAAAGPAALEPALVSPPTGTYLCYFSRDAHTITSSALTHVRVMPGLHMEIAGDTAPFTFTGEVVTLAGGRFRGATAELQHLGDGRSALVFVRRENERGGHQIDPGDTWCYLEPGP